MDDASRLNLTTAAVLATGPATAYTTQVKNEQPDGSFVEATVPDPQAWRAAVHTNAIDIYLMAEADGLVGKALRGIVPQDKVTKRFAGTVVGVRKEPSSTRGIVTIYTGTDRENKDAISKQPLPAGCEQVRTERTDDAIGRAVARRMTTLLGHRVLLFIEMEAMSGNANGHSVRVVRHAESLGVDAKAAERGLGLL
ncbi:hypothetical protein [Nocardioides sp. Leaf285]|uniref:hypothetical protein n=1 Tax=Nocardioides sp. Leaf285 TaxID=1736322 RepID=UPI000702B0A7|nr:hypothetical protein [Nocardioides sp. Leaf285]KQP63011.1 hypothetical protein ASF47_18540 [Nocardioides sp. Leaf285]